MDKLKEFDDEATTRVLTIIMIVLWVAVIIYVKYRENVIMDSLARKSHENEKEKDRKDENDKKEENKDMS